MKKTKLLKKVEELEARIKELESKKPQIIFVDRYIPQPYPYYVYPQYIPQPYYYHQPYFQQPLGQNWGGNIQGGNLLGGAQCSPYGNLQNQQVIGEFIK